MLAGTLTALRLGSGAKVIGGVGILAPSSSRGLFVTFVTPKSHKHQASRNFRLFCRTVRPRHFGIWIVAGALAIAACTRVEAGNAPPNVPIGEGGAAGAPKGGSGSLAGASGDGDGG